MGPAGKIGRVLVQKPHFEFFREIFLESSKLMTRSSSPSLFTLIQSDLNMIPIVSMNVLMCKAINFLANYPSKSPFQSILVLLTSFQYLNLNIHAIHVFIIIKICLPMTNSVPQTQEEKSHPKPGPCHYCVKTNSQLFTVREREHYKGRSSMEQKERLIQLVTTENYRIKEAAKIVKLTYSTAKKIFIKFRKTLKTAHQAKANLNLSTKRASYAQIVPSGCQQGAMMEVISTIAGKEQQRAGHHTEDFEDSECDC